MGVGLLCNRMIRYGDPMPLHSNLAFRPKSVACSLCNETIDLETTKTDESGKPVHEECYAQKVSVHTTHHQTSNPNSGRSEPQREIQRSKGGRDFGLGSRSSGQQVLPGLRIGIGMPRGHVFLRKSISGDT